MEVVAGAAPGALEERRWVVARRRRSIHSCRGCGRNRTHRCTRTVLAAPGHHCTAGDCQSATRLAAALGTRARAGPRDRCHIWCHGMRALPAAGAEEVYMVDKEVAAARAVVASSAAGSAAEVRMHHRRTIHRPRSRTRSVCCTYNGRTRTVRNASRAANWAGCPHHGVSGNWNVVHDLKIRIAKLKGNWQAHPLRVHVWAATMADPGSMQRTVSGTSPRRTAMASRQPSPPCPSSIQVHPA